MTITIIFFVTLLMIPMLAFGHTRKVRGNPLYLLKTLLMLISFGIAIFSLTCDGFQKLVLGLSSWLFVCVAMILSNYEEYEWFVKVLFPALKLEKEGASNHHLRTVKVISKLALAFIGIVIIWSIYFLSRLPKS